MSVYLRLISRLLILGILVLTVVLARPKPAFAGCITCINQCIQANRDCQATCSNCQSCQTQYDACVARCGCSTQP